MASTLLADTISSIIPFLQPLAGSVMQITRTDPVTQTKVKDALSGVQQGVTALAASETASQSKPIVQRIEADAMAVLQVAAGLPLPPPYGTILLVASTLVPSVINAVNLLMATHTTVPPAS
jgi:hypothetical protein